MSEFSVTQGITRRSQFGITASVGTSVGEMPVQRFWFLGGPYTVHGHRAGTVAGNAFWLARAELSAGKPLVRPVLFADAGWAGDRRDISRGSPTVTGAGLGLSMIGGLVRIDVARGFEPAKRWRADLYFEVR
jgi:hemolysin activation/secretion protein